MENFFIIIFLIVNVIMPFCRLNRSPSHTAPYLMGAVVVVYGNVAVLSMTRDECDEGFYFAFVVRLQF